MAVDSSDLSANNLFLGKFMLHTSARIIFKVLLCLCLSQNPKILKDKHYVLSLESFDV